MLKSYFMKYKVIVETSPADAPQIHEMRAALIMANYFECDVYFLRPERYKTPDLLVKGVKWEIKSPTGNGKKTIDNNLRAASGQSENVVLDLARIKMNHNKVLARVRFYLKTDRKIKHLKIIEKSGKVLDIC